MESRLMDYTSRKFILACIIMIISTAIFIWTNKLTSVEWLTLIGINGGGYGILNVLDRWLGTKTQEVKS